MSVLKPPQLGDHELLFGRHTGRVQDLGECSPGLQAAYGVLRGEFPEVELMARKIFRGLLRLATRSS